MSDGQQFEPSVEENPPVQPTAWQMLRDAREARGLSIVEVAQHLKLTPRQVEAMEAGDLAHLPGPAFARGFVRNYARFLHLDPAHFNAVLDVVREAPPPINTLPLGQMPGPVRWRFSSLPAFGIAAALLALAVAGWYYGWFEPRDEQYLADVVEQSSPVSESGVSAPVIAASPVVVTPASQSEASTPVADSIPASAVVVAPAASAPVIASAPVASAPSAAFVAPASSASASAISSAAVSAASIAAVSRVAASAPLAQSAGLAGPVPKGAHRLHFAFDADAWVEVRDANDKVIFSRLNPAGSQQDVQGEAPLKVVIGNAPQVKLTVDGKSMDLTSRTSSNVARLSLP